MATRLTVGEGPGDAALQRQIAERDQQIEKIEGENANLREVALRARAEVDNARKRLRREKAEAIKYANETLTGELVVVVDNLERALESAGGASDAKAIHDGVEMVHNQFLSILQNHGLEPIVPDGQTFDPRFHEAVSAEERDDVADNTIIETLQKGYMLRGRVVRPAMVRVARAVATPEPAIEEVPANEAQEAVPETPEEAPSEAAESEPEPVAVTLPDTEDTQADTADGTPEEVEEAAEEKPAKPPEAKEEEEEAVSLEDLAMEDIEIEYISPSDKRFGVSETESETKSE
jgi:molecular chaperone GrpE